MLTHVKNCAGGAPMILAWPHLRFGDSEIPGAELGFTPRCRAGVHAQAQCQSPPVASASLGSTAQDALLRPPGSRPDPHRPLLPPCPGSPVPCCWICVFKICSPGFSPGHTAGHTELDTQGSGSPHQRLVSQENSFLKPNFKVPGASTSLFSPSVWGPDGS